MASNLTVCGAATSGRLTISEREVSNSSIFFIYISLK
jgi:hypothetical protein